jgi:predicted metalloprotease with PDZ domain
MKLYIIAIVTVLILPFACHAKSESQDEPVKLAPFVIKAKSLKDAGFGFKAKFRHHMIWAGIKELVIFEVGPRSDAQKAGLEVGEKIIQIRDVKVDGLGIKELQKQFEMPSETGKVLLLIQAKDSGKTRTVELQFHEAPSTEPNQALVPTPASVTPAADAPVAPDAGAAHL